MTPGSKDMADNKEEEGEEEESLYIVVVGGGIGATRLFFLGSVSLYTGVSWLLPDTFPLLS